MDTDLHQIIRSSQALTEDHYQDISRPKSEATPPDGVLTFSLLKHQVGNILGRYSDLMEGFNEFIDRAEKSDDLLAGVLSKRSEDYSFKHMRKIQYEESLFQCEDDRYMRGRLTLDKVNAVVNDMATYAEANA